MSALDKLLSISSKATGAGHLIGAGEIPLDIFRLLRKRDGFFTFESALEVFSLSSGAGYSIFEWNSDDSWLSCYEELKPRGVCYAQDIFGGQYVFNDSVYYFDPETGDISKFASSLEGWADKILNNFEVSTGQPIAHNWQELNGQIPFKHRLVPLTPFVLGGEYNIENLSVMESVAAMRLRANLALQIHNMPDGTKISYDFT